MIRTSELKGGRQVLHLQPDGIFALRHRQLAAVGKPAAKHFFLELDRGTMPVVRPSLTQTSILRKPPLLRGDVPRRHSLQPL